MEGRFKTTLAILALFFLSSCIGAGFVGEHTFVTKAEDSSDYAECPGPAISKITHCKKEEQADYTSKQMLEVLGKPDSYELKDGLEYYSYDESLAWRGAFVYAIIPIPLIAPVGYNEATFIFKNGKLVETRREAQSSNQAYCGMQLIYEGPDSGLFKCRAD